MQAKKKPIANVDAPAVESKAKIIELALAANRPARRLRVSLKIRVCNWLLGC